MVCCRELLQNNTVVVQGRAGVLLIDPGVQGDEMATLANDLRELGQPVLTPGNHTLDVDGDDGLATGACRNGLRGSSESKTC